jgi:hypothetical protein
MKIRNIAFVTLVAVAGWGCSVYAQSYPRQSYPPPPPPSDRGPGAYDRQQTPPYDEPGYNDQGDDQGYDDQEPYYDPRPDGNYDDQGPYDDQDYYDSGTYDNQGPVDESLFYSELSPYGRWMQRASYGWVWEPTRVEVGWRPYTRGHWAATDYGWTWLSDEPWGWATYHYGRWLLDREYGWLWVPGTQWGPAWVSFQQGNGYVGWAPLPPSVGFRAGIGIQIGSLSLSAQIDPYAYSFVPERYFLESRIYDSILPSARNVTFVRGTRNITSIRVINNRVVNQSIPMQRIEQVTGQRVRRYQLNETRNRAQGRVARVQGDQITIFRPGVTLGRARPDMTPPVVIQRRQQQQRQWQQRRGQQPQRQDQGQTWQRPQSNDQQPQQQPRGQRPPNSRPAPSQAELDQRYQAQQQRLQARQEAERNRLQQMDQQEQQNQGRARNRGTQRQAEERALQEQNQREQQLLEARHQRERQAAQARPQRQNQQDQQRRQDRQNRRDKKPEPTPPPPV